MFCAGKESSFVKKKREVVSGGQLICLMIEFIYREEKRNIRNVMEN